MKFTVSKYARIEDMSNTRRKSMRDRPQLERTGFILVAVVVVFTISLTLFGLWAKSAIAHHRQVRGEQLRLQAVRLAEAGVQRAIGRRAADSDYSEETWTVPAEALGGAHAAEVRIRIEPKGDGSAWDVAATAEYPAGTLRRAQITKHIEIPNPVPGTEL
jgi:hypothetical protein